MINKLWSEISRITAKDLQGVIITTFLMVGGLFLIWSCVIYLSDAWGRSALQFVLGGAGLVVLIVGVCVVAFIMWDGWMKWAFSALREVFFSRPPAK